MVLETLEGFGVGTGYFDALDQIGCQKYIDQYGIGVK